jgi:hypothetical protein
MSLKRCSRGRWGINLREVAFTLFGLAYGVCMSATVALSEQCSRTTYADGSTWEACLDGRQWYCVHCPARPPGPNPDGCPIVDCATKPRGPTVTACKVLGEVCADNTRACCTGLECRRNFDGGRTLQCLPKDH